MNKLPRSALQIITNIKEENGNSPDLIVKKLNINIKDSIYLVSYQSLSDAYKINDLILRFIITNVVPKTKLLFKNLLTIINKNIPNRNVKIINNYEELSYYLFSGFSIILFNNYQKAIAYETQAKLDRGIAEATSEPVIQGPKDAFNENYDINIGLIRKRIKSNKLWLEEHIVGWETKTKVGILYMKDIAEEELVNSVRQKITQIEIDGIFDAGFLCQLIEQEYKSAFPTTYRTERADLTSMLLLEGRVILIVDNSPLAIIIPVFLVDFLHTADCYYQKALHNIFMRFTRLIAFFIGLLAPAFYIALIVYNQEIIPEVLLTSIIGQRELIPFPAFAEAIILLLAFDIMREGDLKSPSISNNSISILGAVILGQAAVTAGLVSPIMVIIVALTSLSALVFQSIHLINAIRIWRYLFLIFATLFGMVGFTFCGLLFCVHLSSIKSFGKPYLYPFAPFSFDGIKDSVFRIKLASTKKRPDILAGKNIVKQGVNK